MVKSNRNIKGSNRYWPVAYLFSLSLLFVIFGCLNDDDNPPIIEPSQSLSLTIIAQDLVSPIGLISSPDERDRLFVIDQIGKVRIVDGTGNLLEDPFLDVSGKMVSLNPNYDERGLLGFAFHPNFKSNQRVFAYYTAPPNPGGPEDGESWNNISRISEFTVSGENPNQVDIDSERIILEINQPQGNHEGGTIAFGPSDNYLYISIGDGGAANDVGPGHEEDWYEINEGGNGQDIESNLLGDILRIDVDSEYPYGIPGDNPFVDTAGLDEIYAYGFRNPFRFSFDMGGTNMLIVGDAGQNLWEEVNVVEKGGNYGWNVKEGTHCFDASNNENVLPACPNVDTYNNPLIDPVIEMPNANNPAGGATVTVIGGYVYRGQLIPDLNGLYIFGSFSKDFEPTGKVFVANPTGPGPWIFDQLNFKNTGENLGYFLKGFGQDLDGEIYLTVSEKLGPEGNTGKVLKIEVVDN